MDRDSGGDQSKAFKRSRNDVFFAMKSEPAVCEGFFGNFKTEFPNPSDWRAFTVAQPIDAMDAYFP